MSQCIAACVSVEFCRAGKAEVLQQNPRGEKNQEKKEKALVDSFFKINLAFQINSELNYAGADQKLITHKVCV